MQPILITGATGFIGSHLLKRLRARDLTLRCLVRNPDKLDPPTDRLEIIRGDLRDDRALKRAAEGVGAVIHVAALTRAKGPKEFFEINRDRTLALYKAVASQSPDCSRFIFISSQAAAGPAVGEDARREEDPPSPLSPYGESKLAAERALQKHDGPPVTALRFSAVYGPGDREILPFFKAASSGWVPAVTPVDGRIQLLYVHDAVEAIVKTLSGNTEGPIFIAHPHIFKHSEVIAVLGTCAGRRVRVIPVPGWVTRCAARINGFLAMASGRSAIFNPGKARELLADNWTCNLEKMRSVLNWAPQTDFPEGARMTLDWYRAHHWIRRQRGSL